MRLKSVFISVCVLVLFSVTVGMLSGLAGPAGSSASVKGTVKFEGTPPKPSRIDMSQDPLCAKAHPTPATTEDVVVGPGGGLANVVVYVSDGLTSHNFQPPQQPAVLEQTVAREEIAVPVKCNVHPWMKGYIAVFKHPYFAVTDKNGNFEVKDLPPGSYTITAWQEKLGTQVQKVTVGAGEAKTLDFTFKQ